MGCAGKAVLATCLVTAADLTGRLTLAGDSIDADSLPASVRSLALHNQHKLLGKCAQLFTCSAANWPADARNVCARRAGEVDARLCTRGFAALRLGATPGSGEATDN